MPRTSYRPEGIVAKLRQVDQSARSIAVVRIFDLHLQVKSR